MLNTLDGLFVVRPFGPEHCAKGRSCEGHSPTAKGQSVTENRKPDDVINEASEKKEDNLASDTTKPASRTSRWCTDVTEQELESGDKLYGGIKDLDPDQLQPDCEPRKGD